MRLLTMSTIQTGLTLATLCVVAASLVAVFLLMTKNKKRPGQLPPGPPTLPLVGNMHQVVLSKPAVFRWIHWQLKKMNTDILCLDLGGTHVIAVSCPEMACEVLRKNDDVLASRPTTFASGAFSFGYKGSILTPHGEQWKKMRRVLTSEVLTPSMDHKLRHLREGEYDHLVRYINGSLPQNNATVDVRHVAQHFCGNIIRRLVFGKRYFSDDLPASSSSSSGPGHDELAHVAALFTLLNHLYCFSVSDYIPALRGLDLDGHEKVAKDVMAVLNGLHDPIIHQRIRERSTIAPADKKKKKEAARDFLDVLVYLEDAQGHPLLSLQDIRAQTAEMMYALVDNPSNAVEWALAEMMNRPQVMQKAMDELDTVVGKHRLVQESDIPHLNYLKSCIREAFRIHPYHAFNPPHVAMADTTLAGYTIPKGSHVILSRLGLGRNPKVWDNPMEFRPERHLNTANVLLSEPGLRFISFSSGRRGCPGISLGTSATMMLFARMLQGFTWTKLPGLDTIDLQESKIGLALAEPLVLQAKPRLAVHLYA